jgi:hypothetical protein
MGEDRREEKSVVKKERNRQEPQMVRWVKKKRKERFQSGRRKGVGGGFVFGLCTDLDT